MTTQRPLLAPTQAESAQFGNVTYHIEGAQVPMLTIELTRDAAVYFEHHILLWKSPQVGVRLRPIKGALKRMLAGIQIFVTEAHGQGQIAFSRDQAGHIFPLHLSPGQEVHVREHQFLAATDALAYTFERVKGIANLLFGGTGFFIDKFRASEREGVLWLHGYGNVFDKVLADGESIDVEPGGWLYKDPSVTMETVASSLTAGLLGGAQLPMNRFTGPGRIGLQSMYYHVPEGTEKPQKGDFIQGICIRIFGPQIGRWVGIALDAVLSFR